MKRDNKGVIRTAMFFYLVIFGQVSDAMDETKQEQGQGQSHRRTASFKDSLTIIKKGVGATLRRCQSESAAGELGLGVQQLRAKYHSSPVLPAVDETYPPEPSPKNDVLFRTFLSRHSSQDLNKSSD